MPTLMLRGVSSDLARRVKAYAATREIGISAAAAHLLTVALDHLDARSRGASVLHASRTPEERSAAAKLAVEAREAKRASR